MTSLKGQPQPSGYPFEAVQTYVLNPKSITMGQLYGEFDLQTHEWTDGILPSLIRVGINAPNKDKRWYVFDGPVDAVWIENMNTVLDDNKKLCLSSGEIIKLRDTMTMMFEVADLAVASPATVSRCGMVYLEPGVLGLSPFINCWMNRLPPLAKAYADDLFKLFDHYVLPAIELVRGKLKEILTSVDSALLMSFLRLMDFRLTPLSGKENKPPPAPSFLALIPNLLVPWVVFNTVWSIGATCDNDSRIIFDKFIRDKMLEAEHGPLFPDSGLCYDFNLHDGGFTDPTPDGDPAPATWRSWMENVTEYKITLDMRYSDIEIPTVDNVRNSVLLGSILINEDNVLCVGPTGTGKTLTVIGKLSKNMHKKFICDFISFSARTTSNQTQDLIDSKLDRRRKGVFGPPILKRQVFFIDDFNMPALEVYGAQPPIELIRQWMDFGGWYDRKNIGDFRTIIDVNFVAAMGPPGGGRNPVTARLLRHFHYLAFVEMEDASKRKIFGNILKFWICRKSDLEGYHDSILTSTLIVYNTILKELLPTPAKTHYTFNLRDLSKVFQGMLMFDPVTLKILGIIIPLVLCQESEDDPFKNGSSFDSQKEYKKYIDKPEKLERMFSDQMQSLFAEDRGEIKEPPEEQMNSLNPKQYPVSSSQQESARFRNGYREWPPEPADFQSRYRKYHPARFPYRGVRSLTEEQQQEKSLPPELTTQIAVPALVSSKPKSTPFPSGHSEQPPVASLISEPDFFRRARRRKKQRKPAPSSDKEVKSPKEELNQEKPLPPELTTKIAITDGKKGTTMPPVCPKSGIICFDSRTYVYCWSVETEKGPKLQRTLNTYNCPGECVIDEENHICNKVSSPSQHMVSRVLPIESSDLDS